MSKFIPDHIKFAKRLLSDLKDQGATHFHLFHSEETLSGAIRDLLEYVEELETLPEVIENYSNAQKQLDKALETLKEMNEGNH